MSAPVIFVALILSAAQAFAQPHDEGVATNACASLTGHASNRADNPQINQWLVECSRSTTMDGFICRNAKQELTQAGEPFASYANRLKCLTEQKERGR